MLEQPHIVVVDDEPEIRETLREYLELHELRVSLADGGAALRRIVSREAIDLVILDLRMPGEDGFALTRFLRERTDAAIVMLTAADDMVDRVVGLEVGADDYLCKPTDPSELHARINAVMRRYRPRAGQGGSQRDDSNTVAFGDCELNLDSRTLRGADGEDIAITAHEFALLKVFAERPGRVLRRETLVRLVYDREWNTADRSIDLRVSRLRRKLEHSAGAQAALKTVHGEGYVYSPAAGARVHPKQSAEIGKYH